MPLDDYLLGAAFFAATVGTALVAAGIVLRRRAPGLTGVARVLGFAIAADAAVVFVHLVPGLLGILSRGSALASALVLLAVALALPRGARAEAGFSGGQAAVRHPRRDVMSAMALAGAGAVVCWSLAAAWVGTRVASTDVDSLTFHLPNVAKWIQSGSVWRTDVFTPLLASGNYPQNGDVVVLSTVLPWDSDAFARAVGLPFAAVTGLAMYGVAAQAGARRATAALFAAVFLALPVYSLAAYEGAKTDAPMLGMLSAGTFFIVRALLRDGDRSSLVLGGLGLGLAFGTKWYGLWSVAIVVGAWLAAALLGGRSPQWTARAGAGLIGLVAVGGGVWLLRNAFLSGSPLYPAPVRVAGLTLFDVPRDYVRECGGFTLAGYAGDLDVWRRFILPAFRTGYGGPGLVLGLGWLVAAALVFRKAMARAPREAWLAPLVLVACVLLMAAAYAVAPYSAIGPRGEPFVNANLRWLLPALLLAAPCCAWAIEQLPKAARVAAGLAALAGIAQGIHAGFELSLRTVALAAAAGLVTAGATSGAVRLWRGGGGARQAAGAGIAAVLVLAVVAVGGIRQDSFHEARYAGADPVIDLLARGGAGKRRVGLAGVWDGNGLTPVLPAFGPRLRDHVEFVGEVRQGQLRELSSREAFLAGLRRGRYDALVVGRGTAGYGGCTLPGSQTDEDGWAGQAGFRLVAQTPRLSLYSLRGGPGSR